MLPRLRSTQKGSFFVARAFTDFIEAPLTSLGDYWNPTLCTVRVCSTASVVVCQRPFSPICSRILRYGSGLHKEGPWDTVFESSPPQYFLSSPSPNPPIFLPTQPLHEQNIFWGNFSKASSLSPQKYFSPSPFAFILEGRRGEGLPPRMMPPKQESFPAEMEEKNWLGERRVFGFLCYLSLFLSLLPWESFSHALSF